VIHIEIVVRFKNVLFVNVFTNNFIRNITTTRNEKATTPNMTTPTRLTNLRKLCKQSTGRTTLHSLHQSTRRDVRRTRHVKVNMVFANMTFQNFYFQLSTNLTNQIPNSGIQTK